MVDDMVKSYCDYFDRHYIFIVILNSFFRWPKIAASVIWISHFDNI